MKNSYLHYNPKLKELARKLRRNSTLSEVLLWKKLKGRQMMGYDFHRQKPIDEYIVDFYCPALKLAIEIDGESHFLRQDEDTRRQKRLENTGVRFIRFDDLEVKFEMESVLKRIKDWIRQNTGQST